MMDDLSLSEIHSLVRVSACVAIRDEGLLSSELKSALAQDLSVNILRETILQSYLFAGYASAINAFIVLNALVPENSEFLREKETSLSLWRERGEELCRKIYRNQFDRLQDNMNRLHPDLADWMIWEGYGKVLSRPFLSMRVRELLIVAITAVLGVDRQFHSHVRGALHAGADPDELRSVLRQALRFVNHSSAERFAQTLEKILSSWK